MPKTQSSQSKYWCFTLFGFDEEKIEKIEQAFETFKLKYIWGEEICPETGRAHLQGYVEGTKRFRPSEIGFIQPMKWDDFHWEKRKGNQRQNIDYCMKDNTNIVNKGFTVRRPLQKITYDILYDWQKEVVDNYNEPAGMFDRKIHWYWEPQGNLGKSIMAKYMVDQQGALLLDGKKGDALYAVAEASKKRDIDIVIFDLPRCVEGKFVSYSAMEKIKDGCFFSAKFESAMCRINVPHVICFSNSVPDESRMSSDRWVIKKLRGEEQPAAIFNFNIS